MTLVLLDESIRRLECSYKIACEKASDIERRYSAVLSQFWAAREMEKTGLLPPLGSSGTGLIYDECAKIRSQLDEALTQKTSAFDALAQAETRRATAIQDGNNGRL